MVLSEPFLRKQGKAYLVFETTKSAYYRYSDGIIATLTKGNYIPVVGGAFFPFQKFPKWIDCSFFSRLDFDIWYPKVESINYVPEMEKYLGKLEIRVHEKLFEKLIYYLKHRKFENLVGFGPGLTPLGDDILSGYLLVKAFYGERWDISMYRYKTTDLSYQQLVEATNLLVPSPVKLFLETGETVEIENMGNTSGLGWLIGIALARRGFKC